MNLSDQVGIYKVISGDDVVHEKVEETKRRNQWRHHRKDQRERENKQP